MGGVDYYGTVSDIRSLIGHSIAKQAGNKAASRDVFLWRYLQIVDSLLVGLAELRERGGISN